MVTNSVAARRAMGGYGNSPDISRARSLSFTTYQKGAVSLIEVLQADENLLRASDVRVQA